LDWNLPRNFLLSFSFFFSVDDIFNELVLDLKSVFLEVVSLKPAKHDEIKEDNREQISIPGFGTLLVVVYKSEFFGVRNVFLPFKLIVMIRVFPLLDEFIL